MKVVVKGEHVQCYRDGKLEYDLDYDAGSEVQSLYAVTARDNKTGDLILKVVNVDSKPLETEIKIQGAPNLIGNGTALVLTSKESTDENSLENPTRVSPKAERVSITGSTFKHSFPGNSLTVLRLKIRS